MSGQTLQTRLAGFVLMLALATTVVLALSTAQTGLKLQVLATMTLVGSAYVAFQLGVELLQEKLLALTVRR